MMYQYTSDNIMSLMQNLGELEESQLIRFFISESTPLLTKTLLEQLVYQSLLRYNKDTGRYRYMGAAPLNEEIAERRRYAFWVIANTGSTNVHSILPGIYPTQFTVIKSNSECFDVTVVENRDDALASVVVREHSLIKGELDDINHIAVLRRESDKKYLRGLGFDYYCLINPTTFRTEYFPVD